MWRCVINWYHYFRSSYSCLLAYLFALVIFSMVVLAIFFSWSLEFGVCCLSPKNNSFGFNCQMSYPPVVTRGWIPEPLDVENCILPQRHCIQVDSGCLIENNTPALPLFRESGSRENKYISYSLFLLSAAIIALQSISILRNDTKVNRNIPPPRSWES